MTTGEQPMAQHVSPDGRYVWQDGAWVPVQPPYQAAYQPPAAHQPPYQHQQFQHPTYEQPHLQQPLYQQQAYGPVPPQATPQWGTVPPPVFMAPPSPKSSGIAILLSFLWPGAGHLYVGADYPGGSNDKAIIFMILSGVCFLLSLTLVGLVISFPLWLGCAIYTMLDANKATQAWNLSRGLRPNA
jgi:hypothetical protein